MVLANLPTRPDPLNYDSTNRHDPTLFYNFSCPFSNYELGLRLRFPTRLKKKGGVQVGDIHITHMESWCSQEQNNPSSSPTLFHANNLKPPKHWNSPPTNSAINNLSKLFCDNGPSARLLLPAKSSKQGEPPILGRGFGSTKSPVLVTWGDSCAMWVTTFQRRISQRGLQANVP